HLHGWVKSESGIGSGSVGNFRLRHWSAVWTKRRCTRLFDHDGNVGRSPYRVVHPWNGDLVTGYFFDREPPIVFRHRRRGAPVCIAILLRPVVVSFPPARIRR